MGKSRTFWVEVESTTVKIDSVLKALSIAEAAGSAFDALNDSVQAFCSGVGDIEHDSIEDSIQVTLDGLGNGLHWLEATANRPGNPTAPGLLRPGSRLVCPVAGSHLFDSPRPRCTQRAVA